MKGWNVDMAGNDAVGLIARVARNLGVWDGRGVRYC